MASLNFQHRHYVAIAEALAEARMHKITDANIDLDGAAFKAGIQAAIDEITGLFRRTNPKFDVARFRACAAGSPINGRDKGR